jgi:cytochrome c oxidase assembly protein subunit 15
MGFILAQMLLGIVLAHVGIVRIAQVLHIGLSSLLVSALCLWLLGAWAAERGLRDELLERDKG